MPRDHRVDMPEVQVQRRILTCVRASVRRMISKELVFRTMENNLDLELMLDDATQQMVMELHKIIPTDRLKTDQDTIEAWLDVPWEYEVLIEPEPRWWHVFYRPASRWVTVQGHIKRRGTVKIKVEHMLQFPETAWKWPESMGRPVMAQEVTIVEDPRWTSQMSSVTDRPWAAERGSF